MEQFILDVIFRQAEEKKVIRSSQCGFTKGKSCSTNLVASYNVVSGWVDERRAGNVVYFDFSKAFDTVSHNIHVGKLRKCEVDKWTVRWIENWLIGRAQNVMISDTKSSWRHVASGVPRVGTGWRDRMHPQQVCWWDKAEKSDWHIRSLCYHSVWPGQAEELGREEHYELQQG